MVFPDLRTRQEQREGAIATRQMAKDVADFFWGKKKKKKHTKAQLKKLRGRRRVSGESQKDFERRVL